MKSHKNCLKFCLILTLSFGLGCTSTKNAQPEPQTQQVLGTKRLLIGLDGIGYSLFKKLQDGGYFRQFKPVSPMVSSFPSISDPNWSLIMNAPPEQSYTKEHFDKSVKNGDKVGQKVGSLIDHLSRPPYFERLFDFKPEGVLEHFASMAWSETTGLYWLDAIEKELLNGTNKEFFKAFIVNTDFIAHTKGKTVLMNYLAQVDRKLINLELKYRQTTGQTLEIILVSDHGNIFLKPKAVLIGDYLTSKKWVVSEVLENPRDVVFVTPEILSFAAFYCADSSQHQLAQDIAEFEGIHVALTFEKSNQVFVYSKKSKARIDIDPVKQTVSYKVLKGQDPFQQASLFAKGPLTWNQYFHESLSLKYPFALVRAWQGFNTNSKQAASVLVSTKTGYVFANKALEWMAMLMGLESVHGSFEREESLGIVVSTKRELPPLPAHEVYNIVIKK